MLREIDYTGLVAKIDEMIAALEYDSMRSAGKCKVNVMNLNELYIAKARYEKMAKTNTRKEG